MKIALLSVSITGLLLCAPALAGERPEPVVRGSGDRESLAKAMGLRPGQKIILAQTVGYPKN